MSIQIKLRKAKIYDSNNVYVLICQLVGFEFDKKSFEATFEKNLVNSSICYWVIENNESVIGFVSLHIQELLHHQKKVAEVQELCVDEKFTGMGFGKLMLDEAIQEAEMQNCEIIELAASNKRVDAHRFYEREGWERSHFKFTKKLV
jgi:PhnO protein